PFTEKSILAQPQRHSDATDNSLSSESGISTSKVGLEANHSMSTLSLEVSSRLVFEFSCAISIALRSANAKLTGTFYGERFCEKMKRSGMHKNERSKMFPRAAFCYAYRIASNAETPAPRMLATVPLFRNSFSFDFAVSSPLFDIFSTSS